MIGTHIAAGATIIVMDMVLAGTVTGTAITHGTTGTTLIAATLLWWIQKETPLLTIKYATSA